MRGKKKEKREKSDKSEVGNKTYILNRRGGIRPEGGRFFYTFPRPKALLCLKKNREKNEGKTKRQKNHWDKKTVYVVGGKSSAQRVEWE